MNNLQRRLIGPILFTVIFSCANSWAATEEAPVQVHGDTVDYLHEEQKVVGTGNVSIDYEGTQLKADKITVFMATKDAIAEGHVVLTQKDSVFKGQHGEYNFEKKTGNVSGMDATIGPNLYAKAQRIEKISDTHYRAVDSYVTTCCGDNPFYRVQAHQVDIYPEKKVVMKNALILIHGVPIFFVPIYVQPLLDFERSPVQLVPGKNQEWGPFILSKWRYELIQRPRLESKGNVLLDYRGRRGFGGGVENFYHGDQLGHGAIRAYYADDQNPPQDVPQDRYRTQWRHQSKLWESTTLTTELNKLSDPTVIKDFFFREEYEKDAFPDNYISVITAKPDFTLSFLERERLDDFFTVVERSPEIRFDTHTKPFMVTPFYLRQEAQFSNLKKEFANTDFQRDVVRLDTNHTLTYAGHVGDVSVAPHVGTRQTFYSRQAAGDREGVRGIFDTGVDVSTHFYKTYNATIHALGLDINQIRHIFTPTASYRYRPNPTVSRTLLETFDALDTLDKQNLIHFDFENILQTKEHKGEGLVPREIARVIPFLDTDLHTGRLANVGIDAELRPYSWLGLEADATYNPDTRDIDTANFDLFIRKNSWSLGVGQRYLQHESSQMTAELKWQMRSDLEIKLYERYEFDEGDSKEFEATISKTFNCTILDFTYNHREGDTFYVALRLKAFPKASFGLSQSYNSPKAPATFQSQ